MSEVKRLISRLDNARNDIERLDALEKLNAFCKADPTEGVHCLSRVVELLREEGTNEEYQESLDIVYKLVRFDTLGVNIPSLLGDPANIELLLDLLEHEDMTVGVMTSQVLSQIYSSNPSALETAIQSCPTGMNKLLQILPNRSREEVSNQTIVLIQQLTANNEEMKKTVAFNEGFEIIFKIMRQEAEVGLGAGLVVLDCLRICSNTLRDSETCQRLFYGMGGDWHLLLADFFDPIKLEANDGRRGEGEAAALWFEDPYRLGCAVVAAEALANSVGHPPHARHQEELCVRSLVVVSSVCFWLARRGPLPLLEASLQLLARICEGNARASAQLFDFKVRCSAPAKGRHVPMHAHAAPYAFSWKPLPGDDRRLITLSALLLEKYLFGQLAWSVDPSDGAESSIDCLALLDCMLTADSACSRLVVQFVLAPPPPSQDDEAETVESGQPFGVLLLNSLLENVSRLLGFSTVGMSRTAGGSVEVGERCANVLALVFLHGDEVTRELATVLNTSQTCLSVSSSGGAPSTPLLPFLLALAGKSTRVGEAGYALGIALFRSLSAAVFNCDKAARQILEDPANLFLLDIATTASDAAGVPKLIQISACLLLGSCYHALKDSEEDAGRDRGISKAALLSMIDSRIGLTRFTELLKLPLPNKQGKSSLQTFFFSDSFQAFYERLVGGVIQSLYEHYSSGGGVTEDSPEKQIIAMQLSRIVELESALAASATATPAPADSLTDQSEIAALRLELQSLREAKVLAPAPVQSTDEILELKKKILDLTNEKHQAVEALGQSQRKVRMLEEDLQSPVSFEKSRDKRIAELEVLNAGLADRVSSLEAEKTASDASAAQAVSAISSKLASVQDVFLVGADEGLAAAPGAGARLDETVGFASSRIDEYADAMARLAGACSDMAEGLGYTAFAQREGTAARVHECANGIADAAREMLGLLEDSAEVRRQLDQAESDKRELQAAARAAEDEVVALTERLIFATVAPQPSSEERLSALEAQLERETSLRLEQESAVLGLSSECEVLSQKCAQYDAEVAASKSAATELQIEIGSLRNQLQQSQEHAQQQALGLEKALLRADEESLLQTLQTELRAKDEQLLSLAALQERVLLLQIENSGMKTRLDASAELTMLSVENRRTGDADVAIRRELTGDDVRVVELELQYELLKVELESATQEFVEYRAQVEAASAQEKETVARLQREVADVRAAGEESLALRLDQSENECGRLRQLVEDAQFTIENLTNAVEGELRAMAAAKEDYEAKMLQLSSTIGFLEERCAAAEALAQSASATASKDWDTLLSGSAELFSKAGVEINGEASQLSGYVVALHKVLACVNNMELTVTSSRSDCGVLRRVGSLQSSIISDSWNWIAEVNQAYSLGCSSPASLALPDLSGAVDEAWCNQFESIRSSSDMLRKQLRSALDRNRASAVQSQVAVMRTPLRSDSRPFEALTPDGKDMARLHSEIVKERRNYSELKSSYNDLLELLAQQELEIQVFRGRVGVVGVKVLEDAEAEVRRLAIDKYGAYTNFRG